ncbi:MAG: glutathione S-transferase family protein [Woeseiaceae bacterium]
MKQLDLHLVTHALCPYVQRSVIVLMEKDIPYTRTDIDLANPPEWFSKISPMEKVPVLIVDNKKMLFESSVICEYLDEVTPGSLHPDKPLEKARHRAWIEFGSGILDSIGALYNAADKKDFKNKCNDIKNKFQLVENEISVTPFFSGEKFHLIDAVYAPIFRYFDIFEQLIDLNIFDSTPKIKNWCQTLQLRASVQQAVTEDYSNLLLQFLKNKNSYISQFIDIA